MPEAPWRLRFRTASMTMPCWARDDPDRLIYSSNAGGKWELYAWDLEVDTHRQLTDRPEGTTLGALDPSGKHVWWFDDHRGDEHGRWVVRPFEPGAARDVRVHLPRAYSAGLALASAFAVVGSSLEDKVTVDAVEGLHPARRLYAHRQFASVDGLSRDERFVVLSHSEHGDAVHRALRVLHVDGSFVGELWDGPGLGLWPLEWSPVAGDARLLVQHERNDMAGVLVWDPVTGDTEEIDTGLPGELFASWFPDARALLLAHHRGGRDELYRFDLPARVLAPVEAGGGSIPAARVRPDGDIWFAWTSASTPIEIRSQSGIVALPPRSAATGGVGYSLHSVDDVDFFVAEPASLRPHPGIFIVHGGPDAHDRDAFSPSVQAWVDHGFAVILVNYRGSTGRGRSWRDSILGDPGFTELRDIAKVRDRVTSLGIVERERVILSGASWGGYLTLLGLGWQPERWALGIAGVPIGDYVAAYEDQMDPLKAFDRTLFGGAPADVPDLYHERSPITYVHRVAVPVLILAGENDPRCPIRSIDNYVSHLSSLDKPFEVYRYDAGHGSLVVEEQIRQVEACLMFAARYLGTPMPG